MRTTVNLDPRAMAILRSLATHQQKTHGEILNQLLFKQVSQNYAKGESGFPVLPERVPGSVVTTEDVLDILDSEE